MSVGDAMALFAPNVTGFMPDQASLTGGGPGSRGCLDFFVVGSKVVVHGAPKIAVGAIASLRHRPPTEGLA